MQRHVYVPKLNILQILLSLIVGCTPTVATPSPTTGVPTQAVLAPSLIPSTETPSIATPTQTSTATLALNGTASSPTTLSPTATVCATPSNGITYVVQPGDNLNQIALRYNMSAEELQRANCLPSADTIFAGQTLYVPYYLPPVLFPAASPIPGNPPTTSIPSNLLEEIAFDAGGADQPPKCDAFVPGSALQQIKGSDRKNDMFQLCVYGFPMGAKVTVDLFSPEPNSHLVASKVWDVVEPHETASTVIRIPLWMPVGAPTGTWFATARSGNLNVPKTQFSISAFQQQAISAVPGGEIDPFEIRKCDLYPRGSQVVIRGTNFGSIQTLDLGIYLWTENRDKQGYFRLPLERTERAVVNQGNFELPISIRAADVKGPRWVIPVTDYKAMLYKVTDPRNDCYRVPE